MNLATPQQAVVWLAGTASGALVSADPTTLSALGDVGQISATLLSAGIVGSAILDRLRGGGTPSEDDTDDHDLDSLMGDDGLGDDGLDDMDDWGEDDPFGEIDGEDGDTDELEHRLDELEGEVGSLSSTVGTVRSENEEIANQVEEVSENVRKLLDIYEMVTRGINPFVDDVAAGGGGGGGGGGFEGGSLGLFDDVDDEEDEEELDEDIANADAEGFFDEDLAEDDLGDDEFDEAGDGFDEADDGLDAEFDDGDLDGELEDGFDDDEFDAADDETGVSEEMATEINDDEGKSFAELKAEYDSGDAEWAEEAANGDGADAAAAADEAELAEAFGDEADDGLDPEFEEFDGIGELDDAGDGLAVADDPDEPVESNEPDLDEPDDATSPERDETPRQAPSDTSHDGVDDEWSVSDSPDDSGFQFVGDADDDDGKPYLTALPSAYVADLVVMEWLEYLVDESSPTDAARAIRYYENVDWISETVQEKLLDFLVGFGEIDEGTAVLPGTEELTRTHHTRSLSYINRLDGADAESLVVDRWNELGGPDGI